MAKDPTNRFRWTAPTLLVCAAALLAGCSSVPDAVNPVEWYKSTVDMLAGEDTPAQANNGGLSADPQSPPPAQAFPSLDTVPERPNATSGLNGDADRSYASAPIARQGEAQQVLALDEPPAPPAAPVIAVTPVPVAPQVAQLGTPTAPAPARPSISAGAPKPLEIMTVLPSADALMIGGDPFETVVITGDGLQTNSGQAGQMLPQVGGDPAFPGTRSAASNAQQAVGVDGALRVATIVFNTGSANVSYADRQILAEVGQLLKERGGSLHVIGHASSRTRNMEPVRHKLVNFEVSADRADVVAKELQSLGVPKELITIAAASDSQPLYYEIMPSGEAGNRRAEIYLVQ